jgi:hypothetical protein
MRPGPPSLRRRAARGVLVTACIGGGAILVVIRIEHAGSFEAAPGLLLPSARAPLAMDTTRVTLVVDRAGNVVGNPKSHGDGPVNVEADARTPFSRIAAVARGAGPKVTQVSFVVRGLDGRIGALAAQPVATPRPLCILGLTPAGDVVVKKPWYEISALVDPYRQADEFDDALRAATDASLGGHALKDLLAAEGSKPCAPVCRDGCAPILAPDPEAPFQAVVNALEAADAGACLAWQPPD